MGRMRLQELAERHGVSVSTASRALSGKPGVSPELRRNLVEAAREVGYPLPGTLQGKEVLVAASRAAITDYDRNLFTAQVLAGMRERAAALGLVLRTTTLRDGEPEALEAMLAADRPAAIVLLTVDEPEVLALVHATGLPAVLVNGDDPWMRLDSIAPCNRSAARLATDHLLACGHRDLLFLQRPGRTTIQRRLEGWRDALHAAGLPADDARVLCVEDWLPELAEEALGRHLDAGGAPFSAILCAGDSLAGGAVAALEARGLKVPADISVMGMDDLPMVELWSPPLTTVHIPSRELGGIALDTLRQQIDGRIGPPRRVELACRLVLRGSVAPRGPNRPEHGS